MGVSASLVKPYRAVASRLNLDTRDSRCEIAQTNHADRLVGSPPNLAANDKGPRCVVDTT